MFLRSVKAPNGRHEYLRLVESFRDGDKVKQRIVAHLGRKDLLAPHLDALVRLLQAEAASPRWVSADDVSAPRASTWGPILVARHLFEKLSLNSILDAGRPQLRHGQPLSERVFPLVANRLTHPGSEHALAQWLEDYYVCSSSGSRWTAVWKQSRRVKVGFDQLKLWYQTLDDCWRKRSVSRNRSSWSCAICSASSPTWCSTTSPRPTSKAAARPGWAASATAATASRATARS